MHFLAIIVSVLLERFGGALSVRRDFTVLHRIARRIAYAHPSFDGAFGFLIILGVVAAVLAAINIQLTGWLIIFGFAFNTLVLYYCLGPRSFYEETKRFIEACRSSDEENTTWYAEQLIGRSLTVTERHHVDRTVTAELLVMINERLLGVIFWFFLLGPVGAWMYRGAQQLAILDTEDDSGLRSFAQKAFYIVNWPTARLVSFTYLLVGNYMGGYRRFKATMLSDAEDIATRNERLVAETGIGALNCDQPDRVDADDTSSVDQVLFLARRAVMIWFGVFALLTLFGWG